MQCMSCKEDISAKFSHAITKNECPYCGKEIIEQKLQEILASLKILMEDGKDYMSQIEDWMYSNFSLKKVSEQTFQSSVGHYPKPPKMGGKQFTVNRADDNGQGNANAPLTEFAKRAGILRQEKNLKSVLDKIQDPIKENELEDLDIADEVIDVKGTDAPLSSYDQRELVDVFDIPSSPQNEIEKLQKLRKQSYNDR